jgi:hypothetical protein
MELADLVIVGAGPHALTLLARILEENPGDLFALSMPGFDQVSRQITSRRFMRKQSTTQRLDALLSRIVVIDPSGTWLTKWHTSFQQFAIEHLRSPVTVHPDPTDAIALREFAEQRQKAHLVKAKVSHTASTSTLSAKKSLFRELVETDLLDNKQGSMASSRTRLDKRKKKGKGSCKTASFNSFNELDRESLLLPSSKLFNDFNEALILRYKLQDKVTQGKVVAIEPHCVDETASSGDDVRPANVISHVKWRNSDGVLQCIQAKSVVVAIGNTNMAQVPKWVHLQDDKLGSYPAEALLHSHQLPQLSAQSKTAKTETAEANGDLAASPCVPNKNLSGTGSDKHNVAPTFAQPAPENFFASISALSEKEVALGDLFKHQRVLVVGGGLTAAHIALLALRQGSAAHVTTVARRHRMIKQFDAELGWVSRSSKLNLAGFWSEGDPIKRLEIVKQARGGGGTVTPQVDRALTKFEDEEGGRYTRIERMEVSEARWTPASCVCIGDAKPRYKEPKCQQPQQPECQKGHWLVTLVGRDTAASRQICVDRIILATGSLLDVEREPVFSGIIRKLPVPVVGGLPVLGSNAAPGSCQWGLGQYGPSCQLYVMGGYAALSLGPMAANLAGAVTGARQIASSLTDFLADISPPEQEAHGSNSSGANQAERYCSQVGSSFAALACDSDSDSDSDSE